MGFYLQEQVAGLDDLAFAHRDVLDHAAIDRLHDLQLARRAHLGLAPRDFIHLREGGPQQQHDHHHRGDSQQGARTQRLLLQARPVGVARPVEAVVALDRRQPRYQPAKNTGAETRGTIGEVPDTLEGALFDTSHHDPLPIRP